MYSRILIWRPAHEVSVCVSMPSLHPSVSSWSDKEIFLPSNLEYPDIDEFPPMRVVDTPLIWDLYLIWFSQVIKYAPYISQYMSISWDNNKSITAWTNLVTLDQRHGGDLLRRRLSWSVAEMRARLFPVLSAWVPSPFCSVSSAFKFWALKAASMPSVITDWICLDWLCSSLTLFLARSSSPFWR